MAINSLKTAVDPLLLAALLSETECLSDPKYGKTGKDGHSVTHRKLCLLLSSLRLCSPRLLPHSWTCPAGVH